MTTTTKTTSNPALSALIAQKAGHTTEPRAPRTITTRALTGAPRPPHLLIAGGDKVGKSYALATAAADKRVARVTVLEVGGDAGALDGYAHVAGPALELAEHNGTWADITALLGELVDRPAPAGKGHDILAIDGVTSLWAVLSREALAGARDIGAGGWAQVNAQWSDMLRLLRQHHGPVVLTARVDTSDMQADLLGRVRTQKDLAYECDATIQATAYRQFSLVSARSGHLATLTPEALPAPIGELSIPDVLDLLGGIA